MAEIGSVLHSKKSQYPKHSCRRFTASADHEIIYRTQNQEPERPSDHVPHPEEDGNIDFNLQFLSFKYDGILLRYDLDPRIIRTKEILNLLPRDQFRARQAGQGEGTDLDKTQKETSSLNNRLLFVFDTFEQLETARRSETIRLLEEKHRFRQVKQRFLQTRTDLLNNISGTIHEVTRRYGKDFDDLDKHQHCLEKEIINIRPKIDKAERINKALTDKITYVQSYGPVIAEKLRTEESQLQQMRSQKSSLEGRIKDLETAVEDVLVKQDTARAEIRQRRSSLIARLEDKLLLLAMHRDERADRIRNPLVHHSCHNFLQDQYNELQGKVAEFRAVCANLDSLVAANKIQTDATLVHLKKEHADLEVKHKEAELSGKPILTKEQLHEKRRQHKTRRERKEREQREKELRKKQALERNFARMRVQMKEANDHLKELQQERLILDPQIERMGLLEETFQTEFDEKSDLKAELTVEFEQKSEEVEENTQKLTDLEADFKMKIATQRIDVEKARKSRRQQEKLLKDFKKHDKQERKRIEHELAEHWTALEEATTRCQNSLMNYKRAAHRNTEVMAELAEIQLATKIGAELIPGDEVRRKAKEVELEQKSRAAMTVFHLRYNKLVDKTDLCAEFAHFNAEMRQQFTDDLAELKYIILIELQGCKMKFHVEVSGYQMLMWHKRRFDNMREYLVTYGHEQRMLEQHRTKRMYEDARERRKELADAVTNNFRGIRKYYHLNVVHHILHIESVTAFFQNHAAEDGYRSTMELLAAEKTFKTHIKHELQQREHFWSSQQRNFARHLNGLMKVLTGIHEEGLCRSDEIWDTLKENVVVRQGLKLSDDIFEMFQGKLRRDWTWTPPQENQELPTESNESLNDIGEGDAAFVDEEFFTSLPVEALSHDSDSDK